MSDQIDRALRIQETMRTPGWADISALLDERISDHLERIVKTAAKKPEAMTGRVAIGLCARWDELVEFREELKDEVKILPENQR